jgi:hypothetical protein
MKKKGKQNNYDLLWMNHSPSIVTMTGLLGSASKPYSAAFIQIHYTSPKMKSI